MIDAKTLQRFLKTMGAYYDEVDGKFGPRSFTYARKFLEYRGTYCSSWPDKRVKIALCQTLLKSAGLSPGEIDGFSGPNTEMALEKYQNMVRSVDGEADGSPRFCRQADVESYFGEVGTNQGTLLFPYPMKIAWNTDQTVTRCSMHNLVVTSAQMALEDVLDHYGPASIKRLGLDMFGGCLNVRKMRGASNRYSMHSWGIALDIDPANNRFRAGPDDAKMSDPEYNVWFEIWGQQGWTSLGKEKSFDFMHLQACSL